jgi:hypothetical protein
VLIDQLLQKGEALRFSEDLPILSHVKGPLSVAAILYKDLGYYKPQGGGIIHRRDLKKVLLVLGSPSLKNGYSLQCPQKKSPATKKNG